MKITLATKEAISAFMNVMCKENDEYFLESEDHNTRVNAKSMLGVMYATTECGNAFWLVNDTHSGEYPISVQPFSAL